MGTDLTGGLGEELDYVLATRPDDPEMRESVNVWLWDKGDRIGIPRIGIEAVAERWHTHDVQVNIASGDGRVFNRYGTGDAHDPLNAQGRPATLGAGPLSFECVEPFRHWRMRFDGRVHEWTCDEQIAGDYIPTLIVGLGGLAGALLAPLLPHSGEGGTYECTRSRGQGSGRGFPGPAFLIQLDRGCNP